DHLADHRNERGVLHERAGAARARPAIQRERERRAVAYRAWKPAVLELTRRDRRRNAPRLGLVHRHGLVADAAVAPPRSRAFATHRADAREDVLERAAGKPRAVALAPREHVVELELADREPAPAHRRPAPRALERARAVVDEVRGLACAH